MIKFQALPKFTLYCYIASVLIIGFVLCDQFMQWSLLSQKIKIGLLITAAIIGVAGSMLSISKQIVSHLKK